MSELYPLKFKPVYKDYPWGNTRLPALFGREAPEGMYAESWEISTHPDGESVVSNGCPVRKLVTESSINEINVKEVVWSENYIGARLKKCNTNG